MKPTVYSRILGYIYDCSQKNEYVWYSKLLNHLSDIDSVIVDREIDQLFDLGCIEGQWEMIDGKWTRTYRLTEGGLCLYCPSKREIKSDYTLL